MKEFGVHYTSHPQVPKLFKRACRLLWCARAQTPNYQPLTLRYQTQERCRLLERLLDASKSSEASLQERLAACGDDRRSLHQKVMILEARNQKATAEALSAQNVISSFGACVAGVEVREWN